MDGLDAAAVQERLGLTDEHHAWLQTLDAAGAPPEPVRLPARPEAAALLADMRLTELDATEVLASLPAAERQPELWWLLERSHRRLLNEMGRFDLGMGDWPALPEALGAPGRFFHVHVFLATVDAMRAWHAAHGVPADVSRETLAALGRAMAIHRRLHGAGGIFERPWMTLPFRAALFEIGRLQYTPTRLATGHGGPRAWYDAETVARLGEGFRPGDPTVGIHIPASGPLTPESVDDSLRRARDLFGRPLPCGPCRIAVCGSWLLDDQLAEYLPPTSNIVRFQRRFTMLPGAGNGDGSVLNFVFHRRADTPLDELPQRTTLERAAVAHLRAGRHWRTRSGWLEL